MEVKVGTLRERAMEADAARAIEDMAKAAQERGRENQRLHEAIVEGWTTQTGLPEPPVIDEWLDDVMRGRGYGEFTHEDLRFRVRIPDRRQASIRLLLPCPACGEEIENEIAWVGGPEGPDRWLVSLGRILREPKEHSPVLCPAAPQPSETSVYRLPLETAADRLVGALAAFIAERTPTE